MAKEKKKSKQAKKGKCYDTRSNEINDPYDVIAPGVIWGGQQIAHSLGMREYFPKNLFIVSNVGRYLVRLANVLIEIYDPSIKNLNLKDVDLEQIGEISERYRNDLVKKLSQNKGITPLALGMSNRKDSDRMRKMAKENKKSETAKKQTCQDIRGNEINDPYNVIAPEVTRNVQKLVKYIDSLKDYPNNLPEVIAIGDDITALTDVLSEIYQPSLKNTDLLVDLEQIGEISERYGLRLRRESSPKRKSREKPTHKHKQ